MNYLRSWTTIVRADSSSTSRRSLRLMLVRLGERRYELVWTLHHIVLDGWSGALVRRDLLRAYEALLQGEEPRPPSVRALGVSEPSAPIGPIAMLGDGERRELLVEWNRTEESYPEGCIHEQIEARAAEAPDAPAVVFGERRLSYRQLNAAAAAEETFDVVVLNSVAQYFPSGNYLARVLEGAAARVRAGGQIFVGDVRSLPLLRAFHTSVVAHRAKGDLDTGKLRRRVIHNMNHDQELAGGFWPRSRSGSSSSTRRSNGRS